MMMRLRFVWLMLGLLLGSLAWGSTTSSLQPRGQEPAPPTAGDSLFAMPLPGDLGSLDPKVAQLHVHEDDLRIKVTGGWVIASREFFDGQWHFNLPWSNLFLSYPAGTESFSTWKEKTEHIPHYKQSYGGVTNLPTYPSRREYIRTWNGRQFDYVGTPEAPKYPSTYRNRDGSETVVATTDGYRWSDIQGNWMLYDNWGRAHSFGNRSGLVARAETDDATVPRWVRFLDRHSREVLRYDWLADGSLRARDYSGREVIYWPDRKIDVNGKVWRYEYADLPTGQSRDASPVSDITGGFGLGSDALTPRGKLLIKQVGPDDKVRLWAKGLTNGSDSFGQESWDELGLVERSIYEVDEAGLTRIVRTDADGVQTETWHDNQARIIRYLVAGELRFRRDYPGRSQITVDVRGTSTRRDYDEWGRLTKVSYDDGRYREYQYDLAHHVLLSERDEAGVRSTYSYNDKGWRTGWIEASGLPESRFHEYTYDDEGQVVREVQRNAGGAIEYQVEYSYDDAGNVSVQRDALGGETHYAYNAQGLPLSTKDVLGRTWLYTYRADGVRLSETDPAGRKSEHEYNDDGLWVRTKLSDGREVVVEYDARGRKIAVQYPDGGKAQFQYSPAGRLQRYTDPAGISEQLTYDNGGRLQARIDGLNQQFKLGYDDLGRLTVQQLPSGAEITFGYDGQGRLTTSTTLVDGETLSTRYEYDALGRLLAETGPDQRRSALQYDALGRLIQTTDAANANTHFQYDSRDLLTQVENAKGAIHRFRYDHLGQPSEEVYPEGETRRFQYDPAGRRTEVLDAKGQRRQYQYDVNNNLTRQRAYDAQGALVIEVEYTYDPQTNRLTGYSDAVQDIGASYAYDANDRRTRETTRYGTLSFTRTLAYEANGALRSDQHPDGTIISYGYNAAGYLASIQLPGEGQVEIPAYLGSVPQTILFPGGLTRKQAVDGLQRPEELLLQNALGQTLLQLGYRYDSSGRITQKQVSSESQAKTMVYGYDDQSHLTKAQGGGVDEVFSYDKGSSGFCMGRRIEFQPAAVEQNVRFEVLDITIAA